MSIKQLADVMETLIDLTHVVSAIRRDLMSPEEKEQERKELTAKIMKMYEPDDISKVAELGGKHD